MLIYKITNKINGKIYIGQTKKTLEKRIQNHRGRFVSKKASYHLYSAMEKYGWENFEFEVLDATPTTQEELDNLEMYYIELYEALDQSKGYNMYKGGKENPMNSKIVATKHLNKMRSEEVREKISKSMKKMRADKGFSQTHLDNISKSLRAGYANGSIVSKQKGKPLPQSQKDALIKSRLKKVLCVDSCGNLVQEFNSVYEAAYWWQANGYSTASAKNLCGRIKKSHKEGIYIKGLRWYYE